MGEFLGKHPIVTGLVAFSGFAALVGGVRYNKAHEEVTPIRIPDGGSMVMYPRHEMLQVRMPEDAVASFDCGGKEVPIPLLGVSVDNDKEVVPKAGQQAVVECDMAADVPILDADGRQIG